MRRKLNKNSQISTFGFQCRKNIERWLKICTSCLVSSQNLPRDDGHFFDIFLLMMATSAGNKDSWKKHGCAVLDSLKSAGREARGTYKYSTLMIKSSLWIHKIVSFLLFCFSAAALHVLLSPSLDLKLTDANDQEALYYAHVQAWSQDSL